LAISLGEIGGCGRGRICAEANRCIEGKDSDEAAARQWGNIAIDVGLILHCGDVEAGMVDLLLWMMTAGGMAVLLQLCVG
jgi:hypothetical protein